jgi:hypothetical protein
MAPRTQPSLRDLLARERFDAEDPAPAPRHRSPRKAAGSRSCRHASPPRPPPEVDAGGGDEGAVVAVLSGYAGRFLKDAEFRRAARDKCAACLAPAAGRDDGAGRAVLANLELGVESIERLAADGAAAPREARTRSLRNSIRLLSGVASLHSPGVRACGVPDSHLSACAQLYLSVVYKMERNDRASARHMLQVFVDAPCLARNSLLPDLWDHVFLPHLLHLKVWFTEEADDLAADWDADDRSTRMKILQRLYNDHMDSGTAQFAMYYKEWLKSGANAPPVPSVPLPSMPGNLDACDKHSASVRGSSINRNLWVNLAIHCIRRVFLTVYHQASVSIRCVNKVIWFYRYNAVFGTAFEQANVRHAKLDDNTELVLDLDLDLNDNSVSSKTEKLAHVSPQTF